MFTSQLSRSTNMLVRCFRKPTKIITFACLLVVLLYGWYTLPLLLEPPLNDIQASPGFRDALLKHTAPDGTLFLSAGDYGFRDLAVNLYKTSYARFRLDNHLFAAYDAELCDALIPEGAHCVQYTQLQDTEHSSNFNSNSFKKKVYTKTKIVLDALLLNITVIFVDLDIVFLKNPLPYLTCSDCDLIIQADGGDNDLNTGFYLIKPTPASQELMNTSWEHMRQSSPALASAQQLQFNRVLRKMTSQARINHVVLEKTLFPNGRDFFNYERRSFKGDLPCSGCVIVHNNWMKCKARKRYRFKEYGLWQVDDNRYYSDPERKYLIYDNPLEFNDDWTNTWAAEDRALRTAFIMGQILNRTVILPKFHGKGYLENFGYWYDLGILDPEFLDAYREHVFLDSELVPNHVKASTSDTYVIRSDDNPGLIDIESSNVNILRASDSRVKVEEIRRWFAGSLAKVPVLKFHSLYQDVMLTDEIQPFVERLNQHLKRKEANGHWCLNGFCLWSSSLVDC